MTTTTLKGDFDHHSRRVDLDYCRYGALGFSTRRRASSYPVVNPGPRPSARRRSLAFSRHTLRRDDEQEDDDLHELAAVLLVRGGQALQRRLLPVFHDKRTPPGDLQQHL